MCTIRLLLPTFIFEPHRNKTLIKKLVSRYNRYWITNLLHRFFKTEYYSYSYSVEVWKPNSKNSTQSLNFKVSVVIKAQKTQCEIFSVLSFGIFFFLMVVVSIFSIIRIGIRYYSNNLSIRIRIRSKVALRIIFVFGQISEPE